VPRVFNRRTDDIPAGAVYVGRPSKWANPYRVGPGCTREQSIRRFKEEHLPAHPELVAAARVELRGHDLVCWCTPLACHGDVWLRIANARKARARRP